MEEFVGALRACFAKCKMENLLDEGKCELFFRLYTRLCEENEKYNLTAITEEDEVATKHFLDSLNASKGIIEGQMSVIDVGTGAGFPGLPIKIANPDISLTLVDSLNKRVTFLNEVVSALCLEDVCTVHSRAEELGINPNYREKYDVCVSRAVANLSTLCELCLPFVKVGGLFVSLKGPKAPDETREAKEAIRLLGGELLEIRDYEISGEDMRHNIVIIKKISHTPTKYPRKAPKPSKEPLK